ncbi:flavodoxin [Prolixibacteraceae bacterium JC049]|nr:flavodoxin [Prolixibacteraceae bacterium JC049]
MNTAIIYTSKHGTTLKVAQTIQSQINENASIVNLDDNSAIDLKQFEAIIIGSSVHAGAIPQNMQRFLSENQTTLLTHKLGLFMCGMQPDKQQEFFEQNFSTELRSHSSSNGLLGGEFLFHKMNFIERFLVKRIAKVKESVSAIKTDQIELFCQQWNTIS